MRGAAEGDHSQLLCQNQSTLRDVGPPKAAWPPILDQPRVFAAIRVDRQYRSRHDLGDVIWRFSSFYLERPGAGAKGNSRLRTKHLTRISSRPRRIRNPFRIVFRALYARHHTPRWVFNSPETAHFTVVAPGVRALPTHSDILLARDRREVGGRGSEKFELHLQERNTDGRERPQWVGCCRSAFRLNPRP